MKLHTVLIMIAILAALVFFFVFSRQPESEPPAKLRSFIWSVEMEELEKIAISVPPEGKGEEWIKHEDQYWYFDNTEGSKVDMKRWGGGIPLLLSGPGAERLITGESTTELLEMYGLRDPKMKISLVLENEDAINIEVGDITPDGQACYIKLVESRAIYSVHYSWFEALKRLVLFPPYPEPEKKQL